MDALKSILLHLYASPRCDRRLEAAGRLAALHQAELQALYAVVPGTLQFPFADGVGAELLQKVRPLDDERRARTRGLFDEAVAAGLRNARWLDPVEDLSLRDFSRRALYADLLVLGQREPGDPGNAGVPADFIETVLLRRFATCIEIGTTGRARIIHVHYKPLYAAICAAISSRSIWPVHARRSRLCRGCARRRCAYPWGTIFHDRRRHPVRAGYPGCGTIPQP